MKKPSLQAPASVVMIRPRWFTPNPATAADNAFQARMLGQGPDITARAAYGEVTAVAEKLKSHGVSVHLFEDETDLTPDSVFPNNWFSTHPGGHVAIYPMFSPSRRKERRADIIELLKQQYRVQDVIDYSGLEIDGIYLEGTGAMVLDHVARVAYAARSNRTNEIALERFCTHFNFEPMIFDAVDRKGKPIYHTNVLMCIGSEFALAGLDTMTDKKRRDEIGARLEEPGRVLVALTPEQIEDFAGNAIELAGSDGPLLALSTRALKALKPAQLAQIEASATILPLDVPTIELAGGSVRCMLAGVHLARRH